VIRCVVSVNFYCESEIVHTYLGLLLVGSYVRGGWSSVRAAGYSTTGLFM